MVVTGEPPGSLEEELEEEEEEETAPEVIDYLSLLDVLRVSTIMEDVIDQLSILGYIIPVPYERKQSISQVSTLASFHPIFSSLLTSTVSVLLVSLDLAWEATPLHWIKGHITVI